MIDEWYYCIEHGTVEPKEGCRILDRIGPFPTRVEAEKALEKVEQRNQAWDDDPAWNDDAD
jgi:hypothetical protein